MLARRQEHFEALLRAERARLVALRDPVALRDVDDALRLVRESPDDFGICVQCGRPIEDERLELLPTAHFCGRQASGGTELR